ncbi:MAG: hypothetical protein MUC95_08490 [Spirochaetes bacterium]|nr:hypothetical protein [Spirochaetota bacterium]
MPAEFFPAVFPHINSSVKLLPYFSLFKILWYGVSGRENSLSDDFSLYFETLSDKTLSENFSSFTTLRE